MIKDDNKKYCAVKKEDLTISFKFSDPVMVSGYGFKTAGDNPGRDPGMFTLKAKKPDNSE